MRNLLFTTIFAVALTLTFTKYSEAVCTQTGNTPGGGNIINCPAPVQNTPLTDTSVPGTTEMDDEVNVPEGGGVNAVGDTAILTVGGNDMVTTSGDVIGTGVAAISTREDDDTVIVNGGTVISTAISAINLGTGNDTAVINDGVVRGDLSAITAGGDDDNITVNGGTLEGNNTSTFILGTGNDTVNLNGGTFIKGPNSFSMVNLDAGNDILTFGANIDLDEGIVGCGEGFDTLVFAMDVPEELLNFFSNQIALAGLPNGSVTINGLTYEWQNCELLVNELVGVRMTKPIPTLSEWGMIAMAGLIGIVGFIAVRRRTLSA